MSVTRAIVIVSAAAAWLLAACEGRFERAPRADEAASSVDATVAVPEVEGFASEAERTRAMEERAAELEQSLDQAMAEATTEEDRLRAYEEFERGRLELNEMAESRSLDDGEDAFAPPP